MKVLFCTRYIDHIIYFCLQRLAAQFSMEVVCGRPDEWTRRLTDDGINVHTARPTWRFDRKYQRALARINQTAQADLVHCFHGNNELSNVIQWAKRDLPVIAYRAYIGKLGILESPSMYWSVRNPSLGAVVAVSQQVKHYLESFRFLRPANVHVINHGVNVEWIASQAADPVNLRQTLGASDSDLIVASMSNLRPYKRFDMTVRAARQLAGLPVRFIHLGDDRGWRRKASGLTNLHFLGHQESPWRYIAEADVFATTAHNEAFGRGNLEAMACGKPLIGSDTGGLLDLIQDGVNGLLFKSGSAEDFAAKVAYYEQHRDAVKAHSLNMSECVRSRFSSEAMAGRYRELYDAVLHDWRSATLQPAHQKR